MYKALFVLSVCCSWACNTKKTDYTLADILNEHFLTMVDTAAYKTGHLLQTTGVADEQKDFSKMGIQVNPRLARENRLIASALQVSKQRRLVGFEPLWQQAGPVVNIPWEQVNNVGKFQLMWNSTKVNAAETVISGKVDINYFNASQKRAILIFTIIDRNGKGGVSSVYFLQQTSPGWQVVYSHDLERM